MSRRPLLATLALLIVCGLAPLLPISSVTATTPHQSSFSWLHTNGVWVENSAGHHVRLVGVTWYGMETYQYVPAGLDIRPLDSILKEIKNMGFNSIRLPLSDQLVRYNPVVHLGLAANKSLIGLHALQVLDKIINDAGQMGIRIILDDENSAARPQHHLELLKDPLWYNAQYSEKVWIADWVKLAGRYKNNPAVLGVDLRNEPHTNGPGPWTLKTYLKQGATWGPYKGQDNKKTDWRLAAERGGDAILKVNPHLLIFVEGVQLYPDKKMKSGVESYWWGGILRGVGSYPVYLNVPHQLVYSPHEYGPRKLHATSTFNSKTTRTSLINTFNFNWGFILKKQEAPVWIGEFGTCNTGTPCLRSSKHGTQGQWWEAIISFLKSHPYINWSFFPINGTNSADSHSVNSILDKSWTHPQSAQLVKDLKTIEKP